MPTSMHPQAKFDPIPPNLDLHSLVDETPNLKWAQRITRAQARSLGPLQFEKLVLFHVIQGGKPLVIEGWDSVLPKTLFNVDWLEKVYDKKQENVRDIQTGGDIPMTTGHYLRSMKQLTKQWTPSNFRDERRQRLYLKDIDCPSEWRAVLRKLISSSLYYLSENVEDSADSGTEDGDEQQIRNPAPAGDLMSSLPVEMRAENLMCYIGHEGTYTPAHREMCASLGQNIMVEASKAADDEAPGSSIWFMTESREREVVREYFLSMLGHDIEIEKHFAQINAWKKAPFDVHVVEQRQGDFILIPPLAAHQVWNRGTRTMKVAWNRTTVETLELALQEALPKARLVCRDEQYKNKAIIYYTLGKYYSKLQIMSDNASPAAVGFANLEQDIIRNSPRAKQMMEDFRKLFVLFTHILIDEVFVFKEKDIEFIPFDSCITCSYCRSNIFNRFLTCKHCIRTLLGGDEDTYDICMECYAMGRSCACLSGLKWCEQWHWNELIDNYETWRSAVIFNDGFIDIDQSPQPIEVARQRSGKKSVAEICQEALRRRPWKDITQPDVAATASDSGIEPDDDAAKKKAKKKRKKKRGQLERCHVCCHKDYSYRVQKCSNVGCSDFYCYGVLYRAFDMMPQKVLEDENWKCPKCLGICNCGHCRRAGNTDAYMPKNTSLGHDTRGVADDRSVEALVDFRLHNLSWLKATGEESRGGNTKRMQRLREQADDAKRHDSAKTKDADEAMDVGITQQSDVASAGVGGPNGNGLEEPIQRDQLSELRPTASRPEAFQDGVEHMLANLAPAEDPTTVFHEEHPSSYPDPSVFGHQRIGMGYYEQDDTPDKILFDPYQAPSGKSLHYDQSNVPEFVKKSIRAAKRKAKRDNEDLDFVVRSRKHRRLHEADFLASMDPALFDEPASGEQGTSDEAIPADIERAVLEDATIPVSTQLANRPVGAPRYDANEPILRHAKPRASYVEADEADAEDNEASDQSVKKLHRTAVATSIILDDDTELATDTAHEIRRRAVDRVPSGSANTGSQSGGAPKKRGRPPKDANPDTRMTAVGASSDEQQSLGQKPVRTLRNLRERTFAPQSEGQDAANMLPHTPSRAPSEAVTVMTGFDHNGHLLERGSARSTRARGRASRGRARRTEATSRPYKPSNDAASPPNQQFMSLAERMALRGKTFKIGKRTQKSAATSKLDGNDDAPTDEIAPSTGIEVRVSAKATHAEIRQSWAAVNQSCRKTGATVSRSASEDGRGSNAPSGSASSDDEDIPARIGGSSRGREIGGLRARGRGRGRGRGRPRSRPSGTVP